MSMTETLPGIESLTLIVTQEIHVKASLETTFEALLEQIGPENESPEQKMPMILEAWPGGRWYRDLGDDNGHCWGHVQSIKRPTLLEISGPLFMSYAVTPPNGFGLRIETPPMVLPFARPSKPRPRCVPACATYPAGAGSAPNKPQLSCGEL